MELKIEPSILSADFSCLGDRVREVEGAGADALHVDVMDGHFVPNLSMGPLVVRALRRVTDLWLDVHLMVTEPSRFLGPFVEAGANHITFHLESADEPGSVIGWLRERGVGVGMAIRPDTPVERALPWVSRLDMVLVMTVHPGFAGQSFLGDNLGKVEVLRGEAGASRRTAAAPGPLQIQVDGGIDPETAIVARDAGANVFVAGSSVFGQKDPAAALRAMRGRLNSD